MTSDQTVYGWLALVRRLQQEGSLLSRWEEALGHVDELWEDDDTRLRVTSPGAPDCCIAPVDLRLDEEMLDAIEAIIQRRRAEWFQRCADLMPSHLTEPKPVHPEYPFLDRYVARTEPSLPPDVVEVLHAADVRYVRDLVKLTTRDLLKLPGLTRKGISAIEAMLAEHGLEPGMVEDAEAALVASEKYTRDPTRDPTGSDSTGSDSTGSDSTEDPR